MEISKLQTICKTEAGRKRCEIFAPLLTQIMPIWGINTPQRQAMFLAQVMHESGEFRYLAELGNDKYLSRKLRGALHGSGDYR